MKIRYLLLCVVVLIAGSLLSLRYQQDFLKKQKKVHLSSSTALIRHQKALSKYERKVIGINRLQHGTEKSDAYDPHFIYTLFPPEGFYPVWLVADVFFVCETQTLSIISRVYYHRLDLDHKALVVYISDPNNPSTRRRLLAKSWRITSNYETCVIGEFDFDGEGKCVNRDIESKIHIEIEYYYNKSSSLEAIYLSPLTEDEENNKVKTFSSSTSTTTTLSKIDNSNINKLSASFDIAASPIMPHSRWAMVAVFSFSRFLLKLWIEYYRLLGVYTFYLYYNGKSDEIPILLQELDGLSVNIVIVIWPHLHWITTHLADNTHGQPMAINDAFQRFGHLHDFMAFYDLDEFLVLPLHDNLDDFVEQYSKVYGPFSFLRSQCSWSMLILDDFEPILPISNVTLGDLFERRLLRGGPAMSREKYFLNTSAFKAVGMKTLNLHGVYTHQERSEPLHGKVLEERSLVVPGYHVHLLNEDERYKRTKDYRIAYLGDESKRVNSTELGDMVKRAVRRKRKSKKKRRGDT
jgi:hypothetical protein